MDVREERNKLRGTLVKAQDGKVISEEEAGLIVTLVNRFRAEIDKKAKQMNMIQGEIAQLRANEKLITDTIDNMIKAHQRDQDREEAIARVRGESDDSTDQE